MTFQHSIVNNITVRTGGNLPRSDRFQDIIDLYSELTDAQIDSFWAKRKRPKEVCERLGYSTIHEAVRKVPELIANGEYEKAADIMGCRRSEKLERYNMKGMWQRISEAAEEEI